MKENTFILDVDLIKEHGLSINEFITLLRVNGQISDYNITDEAINELQKKQFIKVIKDKDEEITIIREKGKLLIDFLKIEGLSSVNNKKTTNRSKIKDDITEFIEQYRILWKGLKPGSMGSAASCKDKMLRWMSENSQYSKENILDAARNYINSLENYRFLQQADYFIYKKDAYGESSRLSAFIDEIGSTTSDGWSSNLN